MSEQVTISIPARLVPEVVQWLEDEMNLWPEDTAYQSDLAEARKSLECLLEARK